SDADLGQLAFYQDSKRQGGVVFDNLLIQELPIGGEDPGETLEDFITDFDFEDETTGEKPVLPFPTSFTPSSNTEGNGFVVVDATSDPENPMDTGKALYAYDFVGDLSSGQSSHMRFDFAPTNTDNVRVDFDFQRAYETPEEDEDTRIHVGLAPAGSATNNSDFRPFEIRILNNGTIDVNFNPTGALEEGRDSENVAAYETTGTNSITFFANGNNANALPYSDPDLGEGEVPANSMVLFLNGTFIGEYGFINTPDPANAPHIAFFETTDDFGRFGIYQDSKRQGGIVFDNLSIREFAVLGPPEGPTELEAVATGPTTASLTWNDNSGSETGFIIEQSENGSWTEVATAEADATEVEVTGLQPETEYTFRVLATNGTLSEPSNEVSVTTEVQLLPIITEQPAGVLVPEGSRVELSVTATGPGTLTYQWYEGESGDTANPLSGETSSTFTTPVLASTTSYWVRVSNANGDDDSDTAVVEVFEPREFRIVNLAQLTALLPDALPGDTYVLDAGVYPDVQIEFEAEGSEFAPVTLRAEVPGEVIFTGDSHLGLGGDWLVVDGFVFTDGWNESVDQVISFRTSSKPARNSRVTNCAILNYSPPDSSIDRDWIGIYGSHNRFDHNLISGHSNKGVTLVVWRNPGIEDHHRIDNNHFAFRASGGGENGWETLRIGTSSDSLSSSKTVVEYNLFEECNGEIEIISNKSGENTYRYNTFFRSQGMLTLRHGDNCLVEGNIFLGDGVSGSGGIRVIGENHTVINNYIEGTTGRDGAAITVYAGVPDSPLNEYFAAHGAFLGNNTIVDVSGAHVRVGAGFGSRDRTILPEDVIITNNLSAQVAGSAVGGPVLDGDAVLDPLYAGNLYSDIMPLGVDGDLAGLTAATLPFVEGEFGLLRPDESSSAIGAADADYPVALDLDGQARTSPQDVGADELSDLPGLNIGGPLQPDEVGPTWVDHSVSDLPWLGDNVLPGDTVVSPWFGAFQVSLNGWLKHVELGWINVDAVDSAASMWIWSDHLQAWVWSNEDLFPIIYDSVGERWIVLLVQGGNAFIYDFETATWVSAP
ncbi:MAG: chondroitinase-B domain-containing protein, partial [Oceanipulchritudo sp.]